MEKQYGVSFADETAEDLATRPDEDPRWQLVERIIASPGLAKSPKLTSFLRFVTERSLKHPAGLINEQSIGVEVFGRRSGYDSNDDNIVRSHASRLRLKLEAYFQAEGAQETLRVAIPKGSYVPSFYDEPRINATHESAIDPHITPPQVPVQQNSPAKPANSTPPRWYWLLLSGVAALCIATTSLLMTVLHRQKTASTAQPNHALWQELLAGKQDTLIVNGDSSLVIYENVTGEVLSVADYISGNYRDQTVAQDKVDPHLLRTIARRKLTSIVDLDISKRILGRPEALPNHTTLRYARDLHVDDLKGANAIFIGSQEANPWVQLYADAMNFDIVPDQQTKIFTIRNRSPRAGEQAEYQSVPGDPERRAYATVAYLKSLDGTGHVLIIQGTGMAGTEAAADYVLSQPELTTLLKASGTEALPQFELLLETSNLNGNAPRSKLVATRIYTR
jgi:hypothetical protein